LTSQETLIGKLCEHALFRAFMRAVRVGVPTGLLTLISVLRNDPTILQNYAWLIPILVAVDKYLRDKKRAIKKD